MAQASCVLSYGSTISKSWQFTTSIHACLATWTNMSQDDQMQPSPVNKDILSWINYVPRMAEGLCFGHTRNKLKEFLPNSFFIHKSNSCQYMQGFSKTAGVAETSYSHLNCSEKPNLAHRLGTSMQSLLFFYLNWSCIKPLHDAECTNCNCPQKHTFALPNRYLWPYSAFVK